MDKSKEIRQKANLEKVKGQENTIAAKPSEENNDPPHTKLPTKPKPNSKLQKKR